MKGKLDVKFLGRNSNDTLAEIKRAIDTAKEEDDSWVYYVNLDNILENSWSPSDEEVTLFATTDDGIHSVGPSLDSELVSRFVECVDTANKVLSCGSLYHPSRKDLGSFLEMEKTSSIEEVFAALECKRKIEVLHPKNVFNVSTRESRDAYDRVFLFDLDGTRR